MSVAVGRVTAREAVRRVAFAPEIMLTPGEAVLALLALSAGPIGTAVLVVYLLRRAERDRAHGAI